MDLNDAEVTIRIDADPGLADSRRLASALDDAAGAADRLGSGVSRAGSGFSDLSTAAERTAADMEDAFDSVASNIQGALEDLVVNGQLSFSDLADSILSDLSRIATGSLFDEGGLFEGLFSGLASLFGGAMAEGGRVDSGSFYLVGERGPELFAPDTAGEIIPRAEAPQSGSDPLLLADAVGRQMSRALGDARRAERLDRAATPATERRTRRQAVLGGGR
jgi:phage-related minor tail protein